MEPNNLKPRHKGSGILFQNPFLEKLTRTNIATPLVIFSLYAVGLLYWSVSHTSLSVEITLILFFTGILSFTWFEYLVHRHVFHMETYTRLRKKVQYAVHGIHHEFPKDKDRLAMPPLLSITIATVLLLLLRLAIGDFVFAFLPGFLLGYAYYLFIHYIVHAYPPPKNVFKRLWIHHGIHHYKDNERAFGVSSPLWDYIYRTMPK